MKTYCCTPTSVNIAACADAEEQIQGGQHNLVQEAACQCVPVSTHDTLHIRAVNTLQDTLVPCTWVQANKAALDVM